jgi:hypothetical protein
VVGPQTGASPSNVLVTQTNPLTMGGGQLSAAPPQPQQVQQGGMMVQQQQQPQQQQQQQPGMVPGAGAPVRPGAPTPSQLEQERQQNLMTIKQLQQTLEAAQQKDQQLKALVFSVFPNGILKSFVVWSCLYRPLNHRIFASSI